MVVVNISGVRGWFLFGLFVEWKCRGQNVLVHIVNTQIHSWSGNVGVGFAYLVCILTPTQQLVNIPPPQHFHSNTLRKKIIWF